MSWNVVRTILGAVVGGALPWLATYLSLRRERGRRLHELYADFTAAAYLVYTRFPRSLEAASRDDRDPTADGMDQFLRARVRLLMVEKDRTRQRLIEQIAAEAQAMHTTSLSPDGRQPTTEEEHLRRKQHWEALRVKCDELVELLKGSLA